MNILNKANKMYSLLFILSVVGLLCACNSSDVPVHIEVSYTSAAIFWTTDKPTINSIEVYTKDRLSVTLVTDTNPVTDHQILVNGLIPDTFYYYKIFLGDKQELSGEGSFKTLDIGPLTISDIKVPDIIESSATITWVTNRAATSELEYWPQGSTDHQTISSDELTVQHSINLPSLEANTIYNYQVKSTDTSGKEATSPRLALSDQIGKPAPDFTLASTDGKTISLSDYRGKLVMLDFWILHCPGCKEKLSIIQEASARITAEKVAILTITSVMSNKAEIRSYAESVGLTIPILLDSDEAVTNLYNVKAFSTIFIVDSDGIIRLINPEFNSAEELENIFTNSLKDM